MDFFVSFIILNYNTSNLVVACVDSIRKFVGDIQYEVIVVDNNSSKEEKQKLHVCLSDDTQIIESRWNGGFGLGNMLGALFAKGDYYCFLNSDIELVEDCITPLCNYLSSNKDVGVITPQQLDGKGQRVKSFFHKSCIRHELIGDSLYEWLYPSEYPNRKKQYNQPVSAFQINGCFMLFDAQKFWEIGGFDENIFLYMEEYDIGMRMRIKGWKCVCYPTLFFKHFGASSTKKIHKLPKRERYISKIYTYSKFHGILLSFIFRYIVILKLLVKPSKWYIIPSLVGGDTLAHSMRNKLWMKNKKNNSVRYV